jgi:cytochrome P450
MQGIVFLAAGYETTSNALTFCCHLLATNPDKQQILFNEINECLNDEVRVLHIVKM